MDASLVLLPREGEEGLEPLIPVFKVLCVAALKPWEVAGKPLRPSSSSSSRCSAVFPVAGGVLRPSFSRRSAMFPVAGKALRPSSRRSAMFLVAGKSFFSRRSARLLARRSSRVSLLSTGLSP